MHVSKNQPLFRLSGLQRVELYFFFTHKCNTILGKHAQTEVETLDNVSLETT